MNYSEYFPLRFINSSGETIPAYAVMQVDGWQEQNDLGFFKCKKPTESGEIYILNGTRPVPAGGLGRATSALSRMGAFALFDDSSTPDVNQQWGPEPDEWHLKKDAEGFFVIGDIKGSAANPPGFPGQASTKRVRVSGVAGGGGGIQAGFARVLGAMINNKVSLGVDVPSAFWTTNSQGTQVLRNGIALVCPLLPVNPNTPYVGQDADWVLPPLQDQQNLMFPAQNMCGADLENGKYVLWDTYDDGRKVIDGIACFDPTGGPA